jgi:uncharacterized protein YdeI (YjbR/CyaY-like superfamily)
MKPTFFRTPVELRDWLERYHDTTPELFVGFYKKGSGKPSITWPESVDEALCFGWIDGIRRTIDDESYVIRFTPRRTRSIWSAVNIKRMNELLRLGRVQPAGRRAFEALDLKRSAVYSYEQRQKDQRLAPAYAAKLKANRKAWTFFRSQAPWYQRTVSRWVMSAKKEETKLRRLATLIDDSAQQRRIGPVGRPAK